SDLHKTYRKNADKVRVLRGLDLEVFPGEFLSVVGASGSGKSTLLHLLGTLDQPDGGSIWLQGQCINETPTKLRGRQRLNPVARLSRSLADYRAQRRRDLLRQETFGFIFQFYHLLPELTTLENVLVPQMIGHS